MSACVIGATGTWHAIVKGELLQYGVGQSLIAEIFAYLFAAYHTRLYSQDNGPKHDKTQILHALHGHCMHTVIKTLHVRVFRGF